VRQSEYIDLIPLGQAVLCENCSQISCARTDHCVGCGSQATLSLAALLTPTEPMLHGAGTPHSALGLLAVVPRSQRVSH
jgi:hypothetical protein